ncbi:hypothetical protein JOE09_000285 [Pantoea coffeiphila]|nr:hypothetical protein [Pantoea coffeiphila]
MNVKQFTFSHPEPVAERDVMPAAFLNVSGHFFKN